MRITLTRLEGAPISVEVEPTSGVEALRHIVFKSIGVPPDEHVFTLGATLLDNVVTLEEQGVMEGSELTLVVVGALHALTWLGGTLRTWDVHSALSRILLECDAQIVTAIKTVGGCFACSINQADDDISIWSTDAKKCVAVLKGHANNIYSARFSPDGSMLATTSQDATAKLWDVKAAACLMTFIGHEGTVFSAAFSPDLCSLITACGGDCSSKIWQIETGKCITTFDAHDDVVLYSAEFSPDASMALTASCRGTVGFWSITACICLFVLAAHDAAIRTMSFSTDGRCMVTSSEDRTAKLWNIKVEECKGDLVQSFVGHKECVTSAYLSPDSRKLITASEDQTTRVWSSPAGHCLATFDDNTSPHNWQVGSVGFHRL